MSVSAWSVAWRSPTPSAISSHAKLSVGRECSCQRPDSMQAAHQQDHGTSAQGVAQATFADVDRAGKVRNALKFKYPTKQVCHLYSQYGC